MRRQVPLPRFLCFSQVCSHLHLCIFSRCADLSNERPLPPHPPLPKSDTSSPTDDRFSWTRWHWRWGVTSPGQAPPAVHRGLRLCWLRVVLSGLANRTRGWCHQHFPLIPAALCTFKPLAPVFLLPSRCLSLVSMLSVSSLSSDTSGGVDS